MLKKDPAKALDAILQLSSLNKYYKMLATDRERHDFKTHAAKYVNIWLPDCQFEVSFTNRYMVDQWEAKTTARKFIKTGDKIKYLCGNLVSITMDEADDEKFIANAFSITYSSRRKTPSLFLGPARFANHDCNANAKLESRGSEGMLVIAVRDIEIGDEINVHYGDNYFGEDNCECLCASCEKYGQGAWQFSAGEDGMRTPRAGSSEADEPGSRRSKRKRNIVDYKQRLREANTRIDEERPTKRRRAEAESTPTPSSADAKERRIHEKPLAKTHVKAAVGWVDPRKVHMARNAAILSQIGRSTLPPMAPFVKSEKKPAPRSNPSSPSKKPAKRGRPRRRRSTSSADQGPSTDAYYKSHMLFAFLKRETFEGDGSNKKPETVPAARTTSPSVEAEIEVSQSSSSSSGEASIFDQPERQSASPETEPPNAEDTPLEHIDLSAEDVYSEANITTPVPEKRPTPAAYSDENIVTPKKRGRPPKSPLSNVIDQRVSVPPVDPQLTPKEIQEILEPTEIAPPTLTANTQPIAVTEITTTTLSTTEPTDNNGVPHSPNSPTNTNTDYRIPGDYLRTSKLLGPKNSRWVECRTCDDVFIQQDAHQTRRECPRCERHSKLYGFQWPQTEFERGGSERVMDHRTVNRFLSRQEEMGEVKRGRGCVIEPKVQGRVAGSARASVVPAV